MAVWMFGPIVVVPCCVGLIVSHRYPLVTRHWGSTHVIDHLMNAAFAWKKSIKIKRDTNFCETGFTKVDHTVNRGRKGHDTQPNELYVELTATGYVSLGTSGAVAENKAAYLILESVPLSEGDAMSLDDFTECIDSVKKTTASKELRQLVDEGKLRCHGTGKKGSPFRYWKQSIHSFASRREDVNE